MLVKLYKNNSDLIAGIEIKRFRKERNSYELIATLILRDNTKIYIKEYLFSNGERKYAYHRQTNDGKFLGRWDNTPHWPSIKTHPHHYHNPSGVVHNSTIKIIDDVIEIIRREKDK